MKKIHDLLPLDPMTRSCDFIKKDLNKYSLLLGIAQEACEMWEQKKFEYFDPVVGENACQIRAIKIALLAAHNQLDIDRLKERITHNKEKTDRLIQILEMLSGDKKNLLNILEERGIDVEITKDQSFIIQSYLLTLAKKSIKPEMPLLRNDRAAPYELLRFGNITKRFLDNLVIETRTQLSADSVQFINEKAIEIGDQYLQKMSSEEFIVITENCPRYCIPNFYSFQVFVFLMSTNKVPLIVRCFLKAVDQEYRDVGEFILFFKPDSKGIYHAATPVPEEINEPAIIIEGCMVRTSQELTDVLERKQELQKHSILDLILSYAAHHRQYPVASKDILVESFRYPSYETYKAEDLGCSLNNPRLFFVNHVYCSSWATLESKKWYG